MGPLATADFFQKLITATPAVCDQDHIPVLIYSVPQVPDRTAAILHGGPSPLAALKRAVRSLDEAGASAVVLACNTAHYWFDDLQACVEVPMLHIADAVIAELEKTQRASGPVGLLATSGTIAAGIYQPRLSAIGLDTVVPRPQGQEAVDAGITLVKAGAVAAAEAEFDIAIQDLIAAKAAAILLACTEIPLSIGTRRYPVPFVDATAALAARCVQFYHADG